MTIIRIEVKEKPKLVLFYLSRQETADGELMKEIEDSIFLFSSFFINQLFRIKETQKHTITLQLFC